MRIKIAQFLKEFGIRELGKLQSPRLFSQKKLFLPFESIYHYQTDSRAIRGPNPADPLFTRLTGKTFIEHVTDLVSFEGNPRVTTMKAPLMINEFRKQNRFFKLLQKDQALMLNVQNTLVFNYNLLPHMWRYQDTFKAHWFRWNNERRTFWAHVVGAHRRFGYNQFIELHVPETMLQFRDYQMLQSSAGGQIHNPKPGMEDFDSDVISLEGFQDLMGLFNRDGHLDLFDVFQWLGPKREQSLMNQLPPESYEKINFLIRAYDTFLVINLGQLDRWRADAKAGEAYMVNADGTPRDLKTNPLSAEEKAAIADGKKGIDGSQLQRRFLSLIAALVEYSQGNVTLTDVDEEVAKAEQTAELNDQAELPATAAPTEDVVDEDQVVTADTTVQKVEPQFAELDLLDLDQFTAMVKPPDAELIPTQITVDGTDEAVDTVSDGGDAIKVLKVQQEPDIIKDAPDAIKTVARDAHEMLKLGLISPGTFEKALDDATSFMRLPNPFGGEGTIEEAMTYSETDLQVPKPEEYGFRDDISTFDKTMLHSKLKAMQQKATQVLLPKQIMQCVVAAQAAGAAIVGYKIEEVEDLSDHYQIHKVTVKPVRGKASTVLMKIPVIDEDGRYRARGVIYRQRLQRADVPIRKVKPSQVALTSYYNKTFVSRSSFAENNFEEWFSAKIRAKGLVKDDQSVHSVLYAELVQDEFHLPRIYSMMGKSFRGFSSGEMNFYFRYDDRQQWLQENYGLDIVPHEKNGLICAGAVHGNPILVDSNSQFYVFQDNDYEPLGSMAEILGIDVLVAPLEAAMVSVSNKELPVGLVLGYMFGLTSVLDRLKVSYSRHPKSERLALMGDDYVLVFADEKLVFSRADYKSMLVLAGLRLYKNELAKYSIYEFDKKDVYYRLLESKSMNARYLRVVEQLFKSWMDPITKTLLEKMNEPTDFEGLLYRASELLMTDWSPSEVDGAYMRYRGYERLAGLMYNELTKSIQRFRSRNTEATVSMDPHEVWRKFQQDSAKATIEDHNPIAQIREQEAVTYRGDGGRTSQSMVARTRVYTKADLGVLSESTVDSGDVGVVAYLTGDPNFTDMFYNSRAFNPEIDSPSSVMSTCTLLGVATSHDD